MERTVTIPLIEYEEMKDTIAKLVEENNKKVIYVPHPILAAGIIAIIPTTIIILSILLR